VPLLYVFKGDAVPLDMFDGAVRVFNENDNSAGLDKNPFRHAFGVDDKAGMLADPVKITGALVKRVKARALLRCAQASIAGGVSFRPLYDVYRNRIKRLLLVDRGLHGRC
jgi:hypothetical protein